LAARSRARWAFARIEFTIASLVSLVIYLIPLIALLLGFDAIVGERERGSLDLLLSLPITRLELLLGKYLGLAAALALSTLAGFGLVAVLLYQQFSWAGLYHYGGFMLSSVLLGLAFLSLAVLLSVLARDRTRASGLAIATVVLLCAGVRPAAAGRAGGHGGRFGGEAFAWLLLLNPADVFRILNVFSLDDVRTLYGLASIVPPAWAAPADGRRHGGLDRAAAGAGQLEIQAMTRYMHLFLPPPPLLGWALLSAAVPPSRPGLADRLQRAGGAQQRSLARSRSTAPPAANSTACCWPTTPAPRPRCTTPGRRKPSFFCDTVELFNTLLAGEQVRAVQGGVCAGHGQGRLGTSRVGHWIDAKTAFYVLGSKRHGSMGPTIASFAQEADATKFAAEYGGKVLRFGEIKADMVDLSGGALHDTRMYRPGCGRAWAMARQKWRWSPMSASSRRPRRMTAPRACPCTPRGRCLPMCAARSAACSPRARPTGRPRSSLTTATHSFLTRRSRSSCTCRTWSATAQGAAPPRSLRATSPTCPAASGWTLAAPGLCTAPRPKAPCARATCRPLPRAKMPRPSPSAGAAACCPLAPSTPPSLRRWPGRAGTTTQPTERRKRYQNNSYLRLPGGR
jgi:Cu-processing system permease protein